MAHASYFSYSAGFVTQSEACYMENIYIFSYVYRTRIDLFTVSLFILYSRDTKPTCINAGMAGPAEKV